MIYRFDKMHGLGNDFAVFDTRKSVPSFDVASIRSLADRKTGIGFDQLVILGTSQIAVIRMEIRNRDGSYAETCGNALRCVGLLLGRSELTVETDMGVVRVRNSGGSVDVELGNPTLSPMDARSFARSASDALVAIHQLGQGEPVWQVDVGNPHAVVFVKDLDAIVIKEAGRLIETDPQFPDGVNVSFAKIVDARTIELRVWERGAGATRACGSGACASAAAAIHSGRTGHSVTVHQEGGSLLIRWSSKSGLIMSGPAAHSYSGLIEWP